MNVWLILFAILAIIEVVTINLVTIWFALSALVVYFVSMFTDSITIQLAVFTVLSVVFLLYTMPVVKKYVKFKNGNEVGDIGSKVEILECNNNNYVVKFKGVSWNAESENSNYSVGDIVEVKKFKGNKIII